MAVVSDLLVSDEDRVKRRLKKDIPRNYGGQTFGNELFFRTLYDFLPIFVILIPHQYVAHLIEAPEKKTLRCET